LEIGLLLFSKPWKKRHSGGMFARNAGRAKEKQ